MIVQSSNAVKFPIQFIVRTNISDINSRYAKGAGNNNSVNPKMIKIICCLININPNFNLCPQLYIQ